MMAGVTRRKQQAKYGSVRALHAATLEDTFLRTHVVCVLQLDMVEEKSLPCCEGRWHVRLAESLPPRTQSHPPPPPFTVGVAGYDRSSSPCVGTREIPCAF
ncbi:unnamed protein product [Ectocarpus sp. 12 AP-2014]